jgi:hypothetical protein
MTGNINATWQDISCEYLTSAENSKEKKICQLVSNSLGRPAETTPYFCSICLNCKNPKNLANPGTRIVAKKAQKKLEEDLLATAEVKFGIGPGTELHKMIPKFLEIPGCGCKSWAKKMNIWGPDGCEKNKEDIVNKLISESKKRSVLSWVPDAATRMVAERLVNTAIQRARSNEQNQKYKWCTVVTTAPRKDPTLSTCLDSLLIAGFNPYIFAEPGSYRELNQAYQTRMFVHSQRKGVWWNWIESCRWALENTDANVIMTVQDDSIFHPDSKEIAENFMWPSEDVGFVSLYTPKHYSLMPRQRSIERPTGLNRINTKSLWGACALIWPRKVLEMVMSHELIDNWLGAPLKTKSAWEERKKRRKDEPWTIQNSDTAIGKIMNRENRSMWFIDPSPVQHIATSSACGHGDNKGRRNCGRCAKFAIPLSEQLPFHVNGKENFKLFESEDIKI